MSHYIYSSEMATLCNTKVSSVQYCVLQQPVIVNRIQSLQTRLTRLNETIFLFFVKCLFGKTAKLVSYNTASFDLKFLRSIEDSFRSIASIYSYCLSLCNIFIIVQKIWSFDDHSFCVRANWKTAKTQ